MEQLVAVLTMLSLKLWRIAMIEPPGRARGFNSAEGGASATPGRFRRERQTRLLTIEASFQLLQFAQKGLFDDLLNGAHTHPKVLGQPNGKLENPDILRPIQLPVIKFMCARQAWSRPQR
jgi:hypothetical protein